MEHKKWNNRHILSPEHHDDLERDAAAHEFGAARLGRKEAEDAAYAAYKTKHHGAAIQHHLKALRAAVSNARPHIAEQHAALYSLHMKAMGLRAGSMPPSSAGENGEKLDRKKAEKFTSHAADQLLVHGKGNGK